MAVEGRGNIYGEPTDEALTRLRDKVRMLGSGEVTVHSPHAGFNRFEAR